MSSQAHVHADLSFATDTAHSIMSEFAKRIGSHRFEMWFATTTATVNDTSLTIATDSQFVAQWIESHFLKNLLSATRETLGSEASVIVRVVQSRDHEAHSPASSVPAGSLLHENEPPYPFTPSIAMQQARPAGSQAAPTARRRPTGPSLRRLEDFVVGPSNRLAYSAAKALTEDGSNVISPLFIHGECGVGKTHLLQGVCRRATEIYSANRVRYVTGEQFTNEFITAVRTQNIDAFRSRIRKLDLLAIDDVQFLSNKTKTQSEFLHTIDAIGHLGTRIVLASNEHPRQITKFTQSLVSRLLAGMVVQVEKPDRDTRLKLVHHIAVKRGLLLLDAAAELIATRCVGSVRELEGTITKIAAIKSLADANGEGGEHVGLLLVEQVLKDHTWQAAAPIRIGTIVDAVCSRLSVCRGDLTSTGRHRRVVLARSLVAFLGRELTTMSFPEIAQAMGRAHHSTIHTAANRLSRQLAANERVTLGGSEPTIALADLVDQLRQSIARN